MSWIIWHNPRCRKSRDTLQLLRDHGIEPEIRLYLKDGPQESEINEVLAKLAVSPKELMRTKESLFKELGLRAADVSDQQFITSMVEHPALIERPVVIRDTRAVLGRPPETVLGLL